MSNNSSTFDSIDKLLVRALDGDSRQSFNALERKLGIPAETIRYRIKGMLDSGVISHFITIINIGKLGISVHKVLLKLHNVDESRIQRIIERLKSHKMVNWVARLDGVFDIAFTIWIQGLRELSDFVDELKSSNRSYISRLCFAVNIDVEFFTREYTAKHRRSGQEITKFEAPRHPAKIDKTDLLIMRQICMDVRAATAELARKVGVAPETVAARLRRLEENQVITGYKMVLNTAKVGMLNYYVFIFLNYASKARIEAFVEYCRLQPSIVYLIKALGEWDYELNIEVADAAAFRSLMMDLTRRFADIVRDYYALPVAELCKFTGMPEGAEVALGIR